MKLEFANGSVVKSLDNAGEITRSPRAFKIDNTFLTLSMKGNYTDKNYNFYSTEMLYKAWQDYVGKEIECENNEKRIVLEVHVQDDFIFVDTMKVDI